MNGQQTIWVTLSYTIELKKNTHFLCFPKALITLDILTHSIFDNFQLQIQGYNWIFGVFDEFL